MGFAIAAAQSISLKGDLRANVANHVRLARIAAEHCASLVVFPELSLTGYEPTLAAELALAVDSPELDPLANVAEAEGITIVAGGPLRSSGKKPYIGAMAIGPDRTEIYRKRFITNDEGRHFIGGTEMLAVECNDERIAMAVCADVNEASHAAAAKALGATVYAAGVMMTPEDWVRAAANMAEHAARHDVIAVMANHASATGGFESAGRSAAWNPAGEMVACAPAMGEALVIARRTVSGVEARVVQT